MSIHLGTSSWSFPGWHGVFYPKTVKSEGYLAYYARRLATVEVNTSFYGLPEPKTLLRWAESVPAGFTFALKFPRVISHEKRLVDCRRETTALLDALAALGPLAAPAFLQLPPDFTRARAGRELASYLDWLAAARGNCAIAVEVRAADLMTAAFARFLAERGLLLALTDRVGTPDLFDLWAEVGAVAGGAFIRWIGDDRNGPKGDAELSAPQDAKLAQWAARLLALDDAGMTVHGYMHNPYEGHAPASIRRLLGYLGERAPVWGAGEPPTQVEAALPQAEQLPGPQLHLF
jgi:uncharacterized protein YecE (DUF72 family)